MPKTDLKKMTIESEYYLKIFLLLSVLVLLSTNISLVAQQPALYENPEEEDYYRLRSSINFIDWCIDNLLLALVIASFVLLISIKILKFCIGINQEIRLRDQISISHIAIFIFSYSFISLGLIQSVAHLFYLSTLILCPPLLFLLKDNKKYETIYFFALLVFLTVVSIVFLRFVVVVFPELFHLSEISIFTL